MQAKRHILIFTQTLEEGTNAKQLGNDDSGLRVRGRS
jgi:hypothetical protein